MNVSFIDNPVVYSKLSLDWSSTLSIHFAEIGKQNGYAAIVSEGRIMRYLGTRFIFEVKLLQSEGKMFKTKVYSFLSISRKMGEKEDTYEFDLGNLNMVLTVAVGVIGMIGGIGSFIVFLSRPSKRKWKIVSLALLIVIVLLGGGGLLWYILEANTQENTWKIALDDIAPSCNILGKGVWVVSGEAVPFTYQALVIDITNGAGYKFLS
jgi:hypothetical protein